MATDAALRELDRNRSKYDVVITDMQRGNERRAGYDLIDRVQASEFNIPVVIYSAGSKSAANREEDIKHDAVGATNTPERLFELVTYAIEHAPPPQLTAP
jgi:CheY-like chemotaxis protein